MYALEVGFMNNMVKEITAVRVKIIESDEKPKFYYDLRSYIDENSIFTQIGVNYFFYLFVFVVLFSLSLLAINLVERTLLSEAKSKRKKPLKM